MVNEEIRMKRLSFAKYLVSIGDLNSENVIPFSATSILNYHDAIEFLFDLILEDNGLSSNDFSFMRCFDKINEIIESSNKTPSSLRGGLEKLKDRRVNLKHKGYFPSESDIQEAKSLTLNLFNEFCYKIYSLNYGEISLIYLLNDSKTKDYLLQVNENDDMETIVSNLSIAFEYLLKDYDETKKTPLRKSQYQFLKKEQLSCKKLKIDKNNPLKKYIENTNANLKSIAENMKILALGFDFNKYAQFRLYVPKAKLVPPGEFEPELTGNESLTNNQIEFCINFIIECALKLYSVDFKVPEDWGMNNV